MGKAAKRKRRSDGERGAAGAPAQASSQRATDRAAAETPATRPWTKWIAPSLTALAVFAYVVLKCYALHPHRVDEGIYFYDAVRVAEGARLYRDVFFAHPPLHLLPLVVAVRLFGYHFLALKALPSLAGAALGVVAYRIARRAWGSGAAGAAACIALLFAEDYLKASSYATGINLADLLLHAGVLALLARRPVAAGILVGAATMTLLQTAPVAAVVAGAALLHDRALGRRFAIALGATFLGINLVGELYAGGAFFDQVYLYHLHKAPAEDEGASQLGFILADNLALMFGGAVAWIVAIAGGEKDRPRRRLLLALGALVLLQVIAMATRPRVFPFYFQPIFLPLAVALGWGVAAGIERARTVENRWRGVALLAGVVLAPTLLGRPITAAVSPKRFEQRRSYVQTYTWKDAPFVGGLNAVVRALAFDDGVRTADSWHLAATEYLWNQTRSFDAYDSLVAAVRSMTPPDATLFGDSASAPLVAVGAGRSLCADFADTNAQRFTSGTTTPAEAIATLDAAGGPTLVLASGRSGLFSLPEWQRWLADRYAPVRSFSDSHGTPYTLYQRR